MTSSRLRSLLVAIAIVSVAACSGGDDATGDTLTTPDSSTTSTSDSTQPASTVPDIADDTAANSALSDDDATGELANNEVTDDDASETTTTTTVPLVEGVAASIELLTPVAGSGIRPLLEWSPVDGASRYMVVVYAPDGTPYWTWTTSDTSVHVSGDPVLDSERPGPSVIDGMSWGVVALDDVILPVAYSARRPIGP